MKYRAVAAEISITQPRNPIAWHSLLEYLA